MEVHYFGTGGLVRAYSESLQKAIKTATIVEKCEGEELQIEINYKDFDKLKYYCEKVEINVAKIEYNENIVCNLEVLEGETKKILYDLEQKGIKITKNKILNKKFINKKRNLI